MSDINLKKLSKKFPEQDIEWRVQQCGQGQKGAWALIIPYITNRAIMARLDKAVGAGNWKNEFKPSPCGKGYLCGISIKIDNEWITRWDGSEISNSNNIDDVKSTISSSMKRAGVQWGIGRYLYQFDAMFADVKVCDNRYDLLDGYTYQNSKDKKSGHYFSFQWKPKPLEAWALPVTEKDIKGYCECIEKAETIGDLKLFYREAYKLAVSEDDEDLLERFTQAKDYSKERIIQQIKEDEKFFAQEVDNTVAKMIDKINTSKNESSVHSLKDLYIKELKKTPVSQSIATNIFNNHIEKAISVLVSASNDKAKQLRE